MADIQHNIDTHTIEAETVHTAPRKGNKFAWLCGARGRRARRNQRLHRIARQLHKHQATVNHRNYSINRTYSSPRRLPHRNQNRNGRIKKLLTPHPSFLIPHFSNSQMPELPHHQGSSGNGSHHIGQRERHPHTKQAKLPGKPQQQRNKENHLPRKAQEY